MRQLTLDLSLEPEYYSEDFFVTGANVEAFKAIQNPHLWPEKRLLLVGESGSGKTHLSKIFMELFPRAKTCENIENLNEESLFHDINSCKSNEVFLLMTCSQLPQFKLKDVQSRINATNKILIKPADEALLKIIMLKHFSDRQIKIKDDILDYIMVHYERSYKAIKDLVSNLDNLSLTHKRNITIPLVRSCITKAITQEDSLIVQEVKMRSA